MADRDKKSYGGKYPINVPRILLDRFFGKDGGINYDFVDKEWGVRREFIGSGSKQFIFFDTIHGMIVITARTFKEAWRRAKELGYSSRSYLKR